MLTDTVVEIPCFSMVTPIRLSAAAIDPLLWVINMIWEFSAISFTRSLKKRNIYVIKGSVRLVEDQKW